MKSSNQGSSDNFGFHDEERLKKRFDRYREIIEAGQVVLMKDDLEELLDECLETAHFTRALFIANNLLSTFRYDSELWFKRSIAQGHRGNRTGQIASLNRVLTLNPVHVEALVERARIYLHDQKYDHAKRMLLKAYRINSLDDYVLAGIGCYYRKLKFPEKAAVYYRKAIQMHPDNIELYEDLAHCYEDMKKSGKSVAVYKSYTVKYPDDEYGWYLLGLNQHRHERYNSAVKSFLRSLEIYPGYQDAAISLAHTYTEMGDYVNAYLSYRRVPEDPDFPEEIPLNLINLYLDQEKYRAALSETEHLLKIMPESLRARMLKAYCLHKSGEKDKALHYFAASVRTVFEKPFSLRKRELHSAPEESFIKFTRSDGKFKDYHLLESDFLLILFLGYRKRGNRKRAWACYRTLKERSRFKADSFFYLAQIEILLGNFKRGVNYLRKYETKVKGEPDNIIRERYPDLWFSWFYGLAVRDEE